MDHINQPASKKPKVHMMHIASACKLIIAYLVQLQRKRKLIKKSSVNKSEPLKATSTPSKQSSEESDCFSDEDNNTKV